MNYWEGRLITLRGIEPGDAAFFNEWNKQTETQKDLDAIWFPTSLKRQEDWVTRKSAETTKSDAYFFVVEDKSGARAGMIHTRSCDRKNGHFTYGVAIKKEHRRKGYAKEAIRLVLNYYFNELRYHKVTVDIFEFNQASIALHKKLGFQEEGRLRQMIFSGGSFHDVFKFGLLKEEFSNNLL